jgi:hypothetical protein
MNEDGYAWINWPLTPALLRLDPMFDSPRNDPYRVYPPWRASRNYLPNPRQNSVAMAAEVCAE